MSSSFFFPELYAKFSRILLTQHTSHLVKKYRSAIHWPKNASILEFGFGDGTNYEISVRPNFPNDYKEYIATDISTKMIDYARKSVSWPNMTFQELAIDTQFVPDDFKNRFDLILSFFTNHLVQNPKQMYKNIHNMLKPRGQTFQISLERSPLDIVFHNFSKHHRWNKYGHDKIVSPYYYLPNPREGVENDIKHGGFKEYHLKSEPCVYEFKEKEEWQGLFLSTNPLLSNIPVEDIAEYKEDYFNEIQNNVIVFDEKVNDGVGIVKNTLHVIFATK
ncbi:juvenile hormone acid O-methyltransferase-like [Diorhabda sublineata]|uniref:juvenile hormone acid O-methyltransferase-like n=1 Tax=Diorhabda sublineata TaxID=1163346 RepID=UPI0024E13AE9|nr:juvenile hormone acid O-methyltransferase-like [Diorhabda sublineata]